MAKTNSALWVKHVKTFSAMSNIILNMKNSDVYHIWISKYMNYDSWEASAKYVACHDDIFDDACETFCNLIAIYGKDGIS